MKKEKYLSYSEVKKKSPLSEHTIHKRFHGKNPSKYGVIWVEEIKKVKKVSEKDFNKFFKTKQKPGKKKKI
jgi:hypothetical protein